MNKKIIGVSATAIIAMGASSSAWAQAAPARQVSISASVTVQHDSNLARANSSQATSRGLSPSDEKLSPNLNVNIALPFGAHSFSLSGSAGYEFHRKNKRRDKERLDFRSSLAMNLPICDPSLAASFSRRLSDLADINAVPGTSTQLVTNVETIKSIGTTIACGRDFGLRPTVGFDYQEGRNDEPQRKLRDKNVTTYSAGMGYTHPLIGDLLVSVQQRDTRFPNQIMLDGRESGHRLRSYGARFSRNIGSRLQGSVDLNYAELRSRQVGVKPFNGLNWSADISATATPRLSLKATLARGISSSLAVDSNYHVDTSYGLDANYILTPFMNLKAGVSTSRRKFEGTQAVVLPGSPTPQELTGDRRNTFFASLSYAFSPKLRFILDGARETRRASGTFFDYNNNRVGLTAELSI